MRADFSHIERHRIERGPLASDALNDGRNGAFVIPGKKPFSYQVIVSDGGGWDHVSVIVRVAMRPALRCPTWAEMDRIRDLFFQPEEACFQLHPPASLHVNFHPYCLHLWRPQTVAMPIPPPWMVGPVTGKTIPT